MTIIKIDDIDYEVETLNADAKQHLGSLRFVDSELARLTAQTAVLQTARMAYSKALREALDAQPTPFFGDTIKLA